MAGRLLRVVVLLLAAAAGTRAQVWYNHGKPSGTWIKTAMAPLTPDEGKKWFGVGANGKLYERYKSPSGTWHWVNHGYPFSFHPYSSEPCAMEGTSSIYLTTSTGKLYQRYWAPPWSDAYHGEPFGAHSIRASGCSSVHKPGLKGRIFVRGSNGHLYERFYDWSIGWNWRWHGRPFHIGAPYPSATYVANRKITSYIATTSGYSNVFVLGWNGYLYRRWTSQNGGGTWHRLGIMPPSKYVRHIHATRYGHWWVITTDGSVCRYQGGWPCFSLTNRRILDCSDPYYAGGGRRSMFCITSTGISPGSSGYGLYQLTVDSSNTATWVNHGVPTMPFYYSFVDRPNVAFANSSSAWPITQTPKSVFVPSTNGVFELRF